MIGSIHFSFQDAKMLHIFSRRQFIRFESNLDRYLEYNVIVVENQIFLTD